MKKLLLIPFLASFSVATYAQCVTPSDPTAVMATPSVICVGASADLNATSPGNFIFWYTTPTGGTPIGMTTSAANYNVTPAVTTTYYAESDASGGTISTNYNYTGGVQTWTVPAGVDSVTIETWGAQGNSNALGIVGGMGGYSKGKLDVTAGDVLYIYVGGGAATSTVGGYNGGGDAGNVGNPTSFGGGGGGASEVRLNFTTLTDRVIVAAGGGGAGGNRVAGSGRGTGGGGGAGYYGGGGGAGWPQNGVVPTGGSQVAGGTGGTSTYTSVPNNNGYPGVLGIGGRGGDETTSNQAGSQSGASGGNGGGLTGSNGVYAGNFSGQSGAGGSGYLDAMLTNTSMSAGVQSGAGLVKLTYIGFCPSVNRVAVTVTVNPLPTVTATSNPGTTVCDGTSLTLSGNGAQSYSWSGPVAVTDNSPFTVTPAASGTYTVTGTDINGCSNASTTTITINALPTVTANSSASTVCAGTSVTLSGGGATSYNWTGGVTDAVPFTATATDTYTVTGTDANGCTNTATTTVVVNQLPVVALGVDVVQCGGSILLDASNAGSSYLWNDNSTAQTLNVNTSGSYSVDVTDINGCIGSDAINITINSVPTVSLGNDVVQCGGTVTFDAGNGGISYLWNNAATTQATTVSSSGTYFVDVTDANGCVGSDTVIATINTLPVVTLGADTMLCGGAITLDAGNAGATYAWSDASTAQTLITSASGTYFVLVTDANGCSGADTISVMVNTPPVVTASAANTNVCVNDGSVILTGSPSGGTWSGNGVTGSTFSPVVAGVGAQIATYTFTDSNGCTGTANVSITVNACVGITESNIGPVTFYPNPANAELFVSWTSEITVHHISVLDVTGRVVFSKEIGDGNTTEVNLEELPSGVYNLLLSTDSGNSMHRFIKN